MKSAFLFGFVMVLLTGSSQARGQSVAGPPAVTLSTFLMRHAGTSEVPDLLQGHLEDVPHQTHNPADVKTNATVVTSPSDSLFTTSQPGSESAAPHNPPFSHLVHVTTMEGKHASTQPHSRTPWRASSHGTPAAGQHPDVPSELNIGDEDLKRQRPRSYAALDPFLAGLLSVFIIITAMVFIVVFLRFRQQTDQPEFHRLQDIPMDDLMEDTPLSRCTH
ncbi:uncharacterized protein LOC144044342 [Vanacampus margaritifer]